MLWTVCKASICIAYWTQITRFCFGELAARRDRPGVNSDLRFELRERAGPGLIAVVSDFFVCLYPK